MLRYCTTLYITLLYTQQLFFCLDCCYGRSQEKEKSCLQYTVYSIQCVYCMCVVYRTVYTYTYTRVYLSSIELYRRYPLCSIVHTVVGQTGSTVPARSIIMLFQQCSSKAAARPCGTTLYRGARVGCCSLHLAGSSQRRRPAVRSVLLIQYI